MFVIWKKIKEIIKHLFNFPYQYIPLNLSFKKKKKVIDTSAIIDGRLIEICKTGWIEGPLIIPNFVLSELQKIADSTNPIKRARGRRGLEIVNGIKNLKHLEVLFYEKDYPHIKEVDNKLIMLCSKIKAKLITTDYNLNKIAKLKGIEVLNINDLALALKPIISPGETFRISLIKKGKEKGQAVGYLIDGTMVVVENGKPFIGKEIEVTATGLLQTSSGRIIFAKPKDKNPNQAVA